MASLLTNCNVSFLAVVSASSQLLHVDQEIAVVASYDVRLSACRQLIRLSGLCRTGLSEIGTNRDSDRQAMYHRSAGKDRAFDNCSAQLYRHNQSADCTLSVNAGRMQQKCDYY